MTKRAFLAELRRRHVVSVESIIVRQDVWTVSAWCIRRGAAPFEAVLTRAQSQGTAEAWRKRYDKWKDEL